MTVTQSFLPQVTQDKRVLGIVVITTTPFVGNETSVVIGSGTYPLQQYNPIAGLGGLWQERPNIAYMGIPISPTQERQGNFGIQSLMSYIPRYRWQQQPGISRVDYTTNSLIDMLTGNIVPALVAPVIVPPAATAGTLRITWSLNFNYTPQFSFFEANWVQLLQVASGNLDAVSISVGAPSADPSAGHLKVFVVGSYPVIINQSVLFSTLRFVKTTPEPIPAGTYTWPAVILNSDGSTVTVDITVVNS